MKLQKEIKWITVHTTATLPNQDVHVEDVIKWHKKQGWETIGYHWLVCLDGTIEKGRDEKFVGAGVRNYNTGNIHVCYVGGLDENKKPKDTRTDEQKKSLELLLMNLRTRYPDAIIQGHRDFPGVNKACPCFDAKEEYKWI